MTETAAHIWITNDFIPWTPWYTPLEQAKVALISTGGIYLKHGLQERYDAESSNGDPSFREFPAVVELADLAVAHSTSQPYVASDINVTFPLERLRQLAAAGYIGSVAPFAYSFMGCPNDFTLLLANYAPSVAYRLKRMGAEVALVVPAAERDHQTAALVARTVELAGVPTILLATHREPVEAVKPPRTILVRHPAEAPLGNPGNAGKHQQLLREVLDAAWQFEGPGLITELPYEWGNRA